MGTEAVWYLFIDNHHRGPYTFDQLVTMIEAEQINSNTMIWKKGSGQNWAALDSWPDFLVEEKKNLELLVDESQEDEEEILPEINHSPPAYLPPVPKAEADLSGEVSSFKNRLKPLPASSTKIPPVSSIKKIKIKRKFPWKIFFILTFLFTFFSTVLGLIHWYASTLSLAKIHSEITVSSSEQKIWDKPIFSPVLITITGSEDIKNLKGIINRDGPGKIELIFQGIEGMTLSEIPPLFRAEAEFRAGIFSLPRRVFEKGEEIVSGHYWITAVGSDEGLLSRINGTLKGIAFIREIPWVKNYAASFNYQGRVVLLKSQDRDFEIQMAKFKAKQIKDYEEPLREMIERYTTFTSMVEIVKEEFFTVLGKIKKGSEMTQFEKAYAQKVAPLFQGVIVNSQKLHISYIAEDPVKAKEQADFLDFGRKVGIFFTEFSDKVKRQKVLIEKQKELLRFEFTENSKVLIDEAKEKNRQIEERISLYKEKFEK